MDPLTLRQCGMLVESRRIRDLLNMPLVTIASSKEVSAAALQGDHDSSWTPPATYRFSFNPLPALVILLLGMMMSSHHQASVVSTMVHKQWGMLLVGFALARAVTYLTLYVLPPPSLLPSRPPSELVASFCLISAGLIFMASVSSPASPLSEPKKTDTAAMHRTRTPSQQWKGTIWTQCLYSPSRWASPLLSWPGPSWLERSKDRLCGGGMRKGRVLRVGVRLAGLAVKLDFGGLILSLLSSFHL